MKARRSIESNLISLGVVLGVLLVVLVLVLFGVERALGARLERMGSSTMPAQQAITGLRHAVSRLFERQVQVLSTHDELELIALGDRHSIESSLSQSRALLEVALPDVVGRSDASGENARLDESVREVLGSDALLFESVRRGHATAARFDNRTAGLKISLSQLIQEARAVAGVAHLDYVLELRRVADGASPDKAVHGNARAQQEAAEQVVIAVLQLGQLVGNLDLARNEDELNSIVANELAQNLARTRTELRVLVEDLGDDGHPSERAARMQTQFETVSRQISASDDEQSLVRLRRSTLVEAAHAAELREQTRKSATDLSAQLEVVEHLAADEARTSISSAHRALWVARGLSFVALVAALVVGLHSVRRMRESLRALRAQNARLESLSRDLQTMNEGLEGLVAERSASLVARERALQLVLDAMSEGLVSVDLDGNMAGETSKVAVSWFGAAQTGTRIWTYLFEEDERLSLEFGVGYAQIAEDVLPFEVSAACMPQRFVRAARVFSLGYRQVTEGGVFRGVLVIVNDITHQVVAEGRERDVREQHQLLSHLLHDKQGLRLFVRDSERLVLALSAEREREHALRLLHTLKGNTAVFGMESVSHACHELEESLRDRDGALTISESNDLLALWRSRLSRVEEALATEASVDIQDDELDELLTKLRQHRDYAELIELAESWKWLKTSVLLRRLAAQVRRVAEGLGKAVAVKIEHNDLRIVPGPLDELWSELVHVVRNAVDHGLEFAEEREQHGKSAVGNVLLRTTRLASGGLRIELSDDGRGIDFDALRSATARHGYASSSNADLLQAMFRTGVTTRTEATEISGRGIGLSAVLAACQAAGGTVAVDTVAGKGTVFRFEFPNQATEALEVGRSATVPAVHTMGRLEPLRIANHSPS